MLLPRCTGRFPKCYCLPSLDDFRKVTSKEDPIEYFGTVHESIEHFRKGANGLTDISGAIPAQYQFLSSSAALPAMRVPVRGDLTYSTIP